MTGVVCTPLLSEWLALRGRVAAELVRTGRASAGRTGRDAGRPMLVAGVAGALSNDLEPGDLVVADEIRGDGEPTPSHASPFLVGALRRAGLTVHHGPVVSTPCVVDAPADRRSLALTGALAVDTESALLAATAPPGQAAVVRAIVDTPDHRLLRAGILMRGPQALRSLRRAAPVIDAWAAATADREVILAGPRSFCAGAERALALHGPPVYVRRQIVHRQQAIRAVARRSDLVLVLGSQNSSDSRRLVEVAAAEDVEAQLVDDASAVDLRWLSRARRIAITAGASAPPQLVDDLVRCLSGLGRISLTETSVIDEDIRFTLPREVS